MRVRGVKYQHRVLSLLAFLSILTYLDRVCIAVAGPRMQDSLHIRPEQWGWVTSVFFLSYSIFEIPTGVLGDRIGARRVLTRIVLWWSVFTTLTGVASNYVVLLAVRFLFGVGEAGAYPNISTVLSRWIPARRRAFGWGIVFMMSQVGAGFAPLLVVPIQVRYGWQASFFVFGFAGILWGAVWYWWFRDSPREKAGITEAELHEIGDLPRAKHLHLPWGFALRTPAMWQIGGIGGCYLYVMAFFASWLQTYLVKGRGFSEAALVFSSLPYLLGACAAFAGGFASDGLVRRLGLKAGRRSLGACCLSASAVFLTASVLTRSNTWALICLSLAYTGILLQQPSVGAVILDIGRKNAGAVFAFMNTVANAASALSTVTFGYLVAHFNYKAPFVPMVAALAFGAFLWTQIDPTKELVVREEEVGAGVA